MTGYLFNSGIFLWCISFFSVIIYSMILPYMSKIQSDTCGGVSPVDSFLPKTTIFSAQPEEDVGAERLCQLLRAAGQDDTIETSYALQQIGSQYRFQTLKVRDSVQSPFLQQLVQQFSGFFSHTTLHQNLSPKKPVSTSPVELRRCLRNWRNSCRKRLARRPQGRERSRGVEENSDGVFAEISIVFFPQF